MTSSARERLLALFKILIVSACAHSTHVYGAGSLPTDPSKFPDLNSLIAPPLATALVKTVGLLADHRPYQPATSLGSALGLDLGIEITGVRIPGDLATALSQYGVNITPPPMIPLPRLMLQKGFGDRAEMGASAIKYKEYRVYGAHFKIVIAKPEEGPTWALRLNAAWAKIGIVSTQTITPQILISRKMDFADPYLGAGYQMVTGEVAISYFGFTARREAQAAASMAFMGVKFRSDLAKVFLTMEGAYNSGGAHTLGTALGFSL